MENSKRMDTLKTWYALSLALQLGFLVAVLIGGFLLLGWWADQRLQSAPFLLVLGVILGVTVAAYEVYHLILPLFEDFKEVFKNTTTRR